VSTLKPAFHDAETDTNILARILADTSDERFPVSYSCGKLNNTSTFLGEERTEEERKEK